jgi:tRNA(adenine34) deaminase
MCLAAAQAFRVSSIVYGAPDLRLGAIETHIKLLEVEHPYHTIGEVVPGVLAEESAAMLKSFFRSRRTNPSQTKPSRSWRAKVRRLFS